MPSDHLASWAAHTPKPRKKRKVGVVLEKDIQKAIVSAFRLRYKVTLYHCDAGGASYRASMAVGERGYSSLPPGFPDLIGVGPGGRFVAIEVKRPGGKLTDLQAGFLSALAERGAIAFPAWSVDEACAKYEAALGL